jgi:hypothetical protein
MEVAFEVVQVKVLMRPAVIVDGLAVNVTMGAFDEAPRPRQPIVSRRETRRIAARRYLKPHFKPINPLPSLQMVEPLLVMARELDFS